MKKLIALILTATMALSLCACGGGSSASTPKEVDVSVFADWNTQKDEVAGTAEYSSTSGEENTYLLETKFAWEVADGDTTISNAYQMPFYVNDEDETLFLGAKVVYDESANIPYKMLIGFLYFIGADASDYTYEFIVKTANQRFAPETYFAQQGHLSHDGWAPNREYYKNNPETDFIENAASGGIYLNAETEAIFKDIKENLDKDVIVRFGLADGNVSVNGTPPTITKTIDVVLSDAQKAFLVEMYDCYISANLNIQ